MFTENSQQEDTTVNAKRKVKYPHLRNAAKEMGYDFTYLYRVLEGYPGFKGRPGLAADYWRTSERIGRQKAMQQAKAGKSV